jgi:hypothetical protein
MLRTLLVGAAACLVLVMIAIFSKMPKSSKTIQDWYDARLREYHSQLYAAELAFPKTGADPTELYPRETELSLAARRVPRMESTRLPDEVREAYDFYWHHFEEADIGSARVYRVPSGRKVTYAIRVRTDGDDGYLEVYDEKGKFLAAGRTYIEVVAWGSREWLRSQVRRPGELPPELHDADSRTLWGRPLP